MFLKVNKHLIFMPNIPLRLIRDLHRLTLWLLVYSHYNKSRGDLISENDLSQNFHNRPLTEAEADC